MTLICSKTSGERRAMPSDQISKPSLFELPQRRDGVSCPKTTTVRHSA